MIKQVFASFSRRILNTTQSSQEAETEKPHDECHEVCSQSKGSYVPLEIPYRLRILAIADTHMTLQEDELRKIVETKEIDICLLLGDIYGTEVETILRVVPSSVPICGVLGNHDSWSLHEYYGIPNLHGTVVETKGVRITGMDGSIRYKNSDVPMYTDQESAEIAKSLPVADLFISHDSPKNIHGRSGEAHSGLQGVGDYCVMHSVPLNLHGHHHRNATIVLPNGTTSVCCHGIRYIDTADITKTFQEGDK